MDKAGLQWFCSRVNKTTNDKISADLAKKQPLASLATGNDCVK